MPCGYGYSAFARVFDCPKFSIYRFMKLHLPLSLRTALLACLALFPVSYASDYVATGVNPDKITDSNRFYDNGLGVYWTAAGEQPFTGVQALYAQTGSTEFLGLLNNYIPEGELSSESFSGLGNDGKTSWLSTTANVIQYWQSYYGVFSQKASSMPYGYTYAPENQSALGGTQSLNLGMYFYDNWTNSGGDFAMAARWYLTNDHTYTDKGDMGLAELKIPGTAAGYFTPYFESGAASVMVMKAPTQDALDAAIVTAFGMSAVEGQENTYTQTTPGQIAFVGVSSGAASTALTCYGFKTDAAGNVTSLMLAASEDAAYQMTELYVKESAGQMRLYTDAACTQLWERGGEANWYVDAVSCINTPEVLVNMYTEYAGSNLTWTGNSSIWKQESADKSLYVLPDSASGWTAHAGTNTEFDGEYAAYYTKGRDVLFTSTGAGTVELVGDIEPSSVTVNNDLGADYTFTGEGKLTGITQLTKQGEGSLTIATANNYSGGTRLEGGVLVAGNAAAFGSAEVVMLNGTLDLGGFTLNNTLSASDGAEVQLKNGTYSGAVLINGAKSFGAHNLAIQAPSFSLIGNGYDSSAEFSNLQRSGGENGASRISYVNSPLISIQGYQRLNFGGSDVQFAESSISGTILMAESVSIEKNKGQVSITDSNINAINIYGGLISCADISLNENGSVLFHNNSFNTEDYLKGGLIKATTIKLLHNTSAEFSENKTASSWGWEGTQGGLFSAWDVEIAHNDNVLFSWNTNSSKYRISGGIIAASSNVKIQNNAFVEFSNNSFAAREYGDGALIETGDMYFVDNGKVKICENSAETYYDRLNGGVCKAHSVTISGNDEFEVSDNYTSGDSRVRGGAFYVSGTNNDFNITGNKKVQFSYNRLSAWGNSDCELLGGAIYSESKVNISHNDCVVFRGNSEGTRLRSMYVLNDVEMNAGAGQSISIYDSIYVEGNLYLNTANESGEILLSGEYTEEDCGYTGDATRIANSRTSTVVGTTTMQGGYLNLTHGVVLQTSGFTASGVGDTWVGLDGATIRSSGYNVIFEEGAGIHVSGLGSSIKSDKLLMQDGSYLSFTCTSDNKDKPMLLVYEPWEIERTINVSIDNQSYYGENYVVLMDIGADGDVPENWSQENISVSGASFDQLVWQDGYLYYNISGAEIPSVKPYVWTGEQGNTWNFNEQNWSCSDNVTAYEDYKEVLFSNSGTEEILIEGELHPRRVTVDSAENLSFVGEGKLSGGSSLVKRGEGTLLISTTNDFSGDTHLEGGTIIAGTSAAFGAGVLSLKSGTLDYNGNTIVNDIIIGEDAAVVLASGVSTGDFLLNKASSVTMHDFRVEADMISINGEKESTVLDLDYLLLYQRDGEAMRINGGFLSAENLDISSTSLFQAHNLNVIKKNAGELFGGVAYAQNMSIIGNNEIEFYGNTLNIAHWGICGGMLYADSSLDIKENQSIRIYQNDITGNYAGINGGIIASADVLIEENGHVSICDNVFSQPNAYMHGAIMSAEYLHIIGNDSVVINGNEATVDRCGVYGGLISAVTEIKDNNTIEIKGNRTTSKDFIWGGVIYQSGGSALFENNTNLTVEDNVFTSLQGEALGGCVYVTSYFGEDPDGIAIVDNTDFKLTGNGVASPTVALGGALYSENFVKIAGNDCVEFRKNYEQQSDNYRLRSVYALGNVEVSASENQVVNIYDSIYVDKNLTINQNLAQGAVRLSGEYIEDDLWYVKKNAGTTVEIMNSRTNRVEGSTIVEGGELFIENGAMLHTDSLQVEAGTVNLFNGVIESSGYQITFARDSELHVQGSANVVNAETFTMQDGSTLSITLDSVNKRRAVLSLFNPLQIMGNMTLDINFADKAREDYYILLDVGDNSPLLENWATTQITLIGAEPGQLVWQDGRLYLNCSGGDIPQMQTLYWQGKNGDTWNDATFDYPQSGSSVSQWDAAVVVFSDVSSGAVNLAGVRMPGRVLVDSSVDYSFAGDGKLSGSMRLTKRGSGNLIIGTTNDYTGGTLLEGGSITAGNAHAFGSGGMELKQGVLNLNGFEIENTITVSKGAEVVIKDGTATNDFLVFNARSYTADNFRVFADCISMTGDGAVSKAHFINLNVTDGSSYEYRGGYLGADCISINGMAELYMGKARIETNCSSLYGGLVYGSTIDLNSNGSVRLRDNTVSSSGQSSSSVYGGLVYGSTVNVNNNGSVCLSDNSVSSSFLYGGLVYCQELILTDNDTLLVNHNDGQAIANVYGGSMRASTLTIQDNQLVEMVGNTVKSTSQSSGSDVYGGVLYSYNGALIIGNESINISNNVAESASDIVRGGAICQSYSGTLSSTTTRLTGNGDVTIMGNAAISMIDALGSAIYSNGDVQLANNRSVLLRGNYEKQGEAYRLRSIYACGNLELSANAGQNIQVYDSVYTGGKLELNANGAAGEILLSGAYTEADLLVAKSGVAGTENEITNSRTNTVVGTTTLGGGVLRMEAGVILKTGGFRAAADCDAQVWLDNAVLNCLGYDVSFGSGAGLVVGGSNTLTASNFTMQEGSYLSFDLRNENKNLTALSVNACMSLNGLDVVVMNTDIMAAGRYKLLTVAEGAQYDTSSWAQDINSVTGADAGALSWENGTLYYTSTNSWVISKTEDASIIEDTEGVDIVIGNGAMVNIDASVTVPTCRQGHPNCDNPKHGGRPGNPGQGHAKPKPDNSGNGGSEDDTLSSDGSASLVIVEGSAYIKDRGAFEGLLDFRGSAEEERHFYTEKDLGVAYITVFTDEDATSHLHIGEGRKVDTVGIVGDGKLEVYGAGRMVLNGHDADESSSLYYGTLGVNEGAVRVENDSQAYVAHTEVRGAETNAGMEVGKGATMTGESLSVSGENAILHNDGSIAMTGGIQVAGGTVKGSGTFSGLTMNGGKLVIGNSPGLQSYTDDLVLSAGKVEFSVGGFEQVAADSLNGWSEAVYSSVAMNGHAFTVGDGVTITLAFGGSALDSLVLSTTENPVEFSLTLVQGMGNVLDAGTLAALVGQTQFIITDETPGLSSATLGLAGTDLGAYVSGVSYELKDGSLTVSGSIAVNGNLTVPEPTTATLSLLALTVLAARRRRRYGRVDAAA